ncbi:unnamed protein product [Clonostachys chloroleuca]|uniref:Uncharacterized protein n=1 Tax=Clonostachys chloroleuca TaxID=1926264 RepID=A0AA35LXD7_9HYPO|nr:unnamed protein product [Clonostachys chloroleuca]
MSGSFACSSERRAPWKSSRDGRPSMTQTAHAFSQNVILFGRPARQSPLCQGIQNIVVSLGALVVLSPGDEGRDLVP